MINKAGLKILFQKITFLRAYFLAKKANEIEEVVKIISDKCSIETVVTRRDSNLDYCDLGEFLVFHTNSLDPEDAVRLYNNFCLMTRGKDSITRLFESAKVRGADYVGFKMPCSLVVKIK